jgi:hypothetical protein
VSGKALSAGSMKVEGFLRLTGFFESLAGVLVLEYAGSQQVPTECPALPTPCGGPTIDYGLYNTIGWALVVIGLIQIAASFYIGRNRKSKPDAVANTRPIKDQTPPTSSTSSPAKREEIRRLGVSHLPAAQPLQELRRLNPQRRDSGALIGLPPHVASG